MIVLPEKKIAVIDQMDKGMDRLRTIVAAMQDRSMLDDSTVMAISCSLFDTIDTLEPVREAINKAHGEGRI